MRRITRSTCERLRPLRKSAGVYCEFPVYRLSEFNTTGPSDARPNHSSAATATGVAAGRTALSRRTYAHSWATTFSSTGSYRTRTTAHVSGMRQSTLLPAIPPRPLQRRKSQGLVQGLVELVDGTVHLLRLTSRV
jgi:hypothetical protein